MDRRPGFEMVQRLARMSPSLHPPLFLRRTEVPVDFVQTLHIGPIDADKGLLEVLEPWTPPVMRKVTERRHSSSIGVMNARKSGERWGFAQPRTVNDRVGLFVRVPRRISSIDSPS